MNYFSYFLTVFHGLLSSIILLTGLYLLGITALPRIIFERTNITCTPFFCGAGLLSLVSWYGIQSNIPLLVIFKILFVFLCIVSVFRFSQHSFRLFFSAIFQKTTWLGLITFILFYILMTFIIPQPIDSKHLPFITLGNNDIFSYLNNARHLLHLGESNIATLTSYTISGNYDQTPATFYFIDLFSVFYRFDLMAAAVPVIYTCMALIGLMITRYCRNVFNLSHSISMGIAAVIISCPFYRYIGAQYFLSTLMGMLPLLGLLADIAKWNFSTTKKKLLDFLFATIPYYAFLFFVYSVIFVSSIIVINALILLMLLIESIQNYNQLKNISVVNIFKKMVFWSVALFTSIAIVFLLDLIHAKNFLNLFIGYGGAGQQGWPLHWISPFSRLGIYGNIEIQTPKLIIIWMSVFVTLLIGMIFAVIKNNKKITSGEYALFFMALVAFFIYDLYFYVSDLDHQYQPWKFASYYNLPLAGVIWAMLIKIIYTADKKLQTHENIGSEAIPPLWMKVPDRAEERKSYTRRIITILFVFLVAGNIYHAEHHRSNVQIFSAKYRDLALLDKIDAPAIWVDMETYSSTFLAPYYIQHKKLYLLSNSYYTPSVLDPKKVSEHWPLFVEQPVSACENISPKEGMKIGEMGCLYFTNEHH